eukprot:TRINITY_DN3347_c0_g1_i1.p1 TRINITY_DN3347_c0_g1~~TRINITY_DN3347_c0_g1_i1.p1  ORF type:complete len:185 (+),score=56.90 TRINITY_DN3347_c0_g1_i1:304-858(+)
MADIDWVDVNKKLPYKRTEEEKNKRKQLWSCIDINGNGYVSLAEITKGIRDVINIEDLFDCRPAINRAFHFSRDVHTSSDSHGDDYLEFREFRLFLQAVRQFFEYYQAFDRIDTGDDNRVSKEEFTSEVIKETIERWVGPIENMEEEFEKIDKNGGGQILFSEFVDWALERNLDIEDDVDEDQP